MPRSCWVYILSTPERMLYVGVAAHLHRRLAQHRGGSGSGFVRKRSAWDLVLVERFSRPGEAIAREKQLKGWKRRRKIELILASNPDWMDLSGEWVR